MTGERNQIAFNDFIDLISGGTPKTNITEYWGGSIPWLSVVDFNTGYRWVSSAEKAITKRGLDESATNILNRGDIIISARGTVGAVAQLAIPMAFNQSCYGIRGKKGIADTNFVYYALRHAVTQMQQVAHGGVFNTITRDTFKIIKTRLPSLNEQQAIAHILGTLDDKIELNRKMNKTLEEMARAIFKSWFVDFEPVHAKAAVRREHSDWTSTQISRAALPNLKTEIAELFPDSFEDSELGKIPKGWRIGKFGDCCNVKGGYAYKSKNFTDEGYPLVRIKNITPEKTVDLFDVVYIPEDIALQTRSFWLTDGDLLMAMTGATIGKFGLIVNRKEMSPAVLNQRVAKIAQKNVAANKSWFIFISLIVTDVYDQVVNIGGGSAQPNISSSQIENCRFVVPADATILSFTNYIDPIMKKWLSNIKESELLAAIRDTLLPKLISGELRVPDAERIVGRYI